MAGNYGYQYGTSPRKLEPEYRPKSQKSKKVQKKTVQPNKTANKKKNKQKKKFKLSFEAKFFINSILIFSIIFAIIACEALVQQKYKERESLKQQYDEILANTNMGVDDSEDIRTIASEYGMQTKSATLINLDTTDYIQASGNQVKMDEPGIFNKVINFIKGIF